LWLFIEELVAMGTTVLLTTQYMEEAERLAQQIVILDNGRIIAADSAQALKEQVGGSVLEARVADRRELERAATLLSSLTGSHVHVDLEQQLLSAPAKGGTALLITAGRRLQEEQIVLDDLGIHRPSLDDVFLSLTGGLREPSRDEGQTDF
jgi:ABC-2 type transport system ATP-binding protein